MRTPADEYGWTTRSAPARRSLRAAESSDARATMKMSGRRRARGQGDEDVLLVRVGRRDERPSPARGPPFRDSCPLRRRRARRERAASTAAAIDVGFTSTTTYSVAACSNSAATLRPTRPNPQMMMWSRSWAMALLLRPSPKYSPTTPRVISSTTAPAR